MTCRATSAQSPKRWGLAMPAGARIACGGLETVRTAHQSAPSLCVELMGRTAR